MILIHCSSSKRGHALFVSAQRVAAFLLVLLLISCARKGPMLAPEELTPPAVRDLQAETREETVVLTWTRPKASQANVSGLQVRSFLIERACGSEGSPFLLVQKVEVTDLGRIRKRRRFQLLDKLPPEPRPCRYRVVTENHFGYRSEPSNVAMVPAS